MTFTSGDIYDYLGVPPGEATDWHAAFLKGQFFAAHIRDRYVYRLIQKVWPPED